jgi:hypothetical protein
MRLIQVGLVSALAIVPALAQTSVLPLSSNDEKLASRQFGPIHDKTEHGDGTSTSTNWSGYAVTGTGFTSAEASWIVPAAVCSGVKKDQYAAFWVGIDGYDSNSVEQTGTDSDCVGTTPTYYAWYEFYPNPSFEITSVPVSPGNVMTASVTYNSSGFTVTIVNSTTGRTFTRTHAVPSAKRTSAEWIVEAPCCAARDGILPLSDFGTSVFGLDYTKIAATNYATSSANSGPIGSFGAANIEQITKTGTASSPQTSTCSTLSSDGTSFSCTWAAN